MFSIESIKAMEADIAKALQAVEKKYGATITYSSPYGAASEYKTPNTSFTYATKLTLEITKPMPFEAEYRRVADKYGLKTDWIGMTFWIPGGRSGVGSVYSIIGFDSKTETVVACLSGKSKIGKLYDFKPSFVVEQMTKAFQPSFVVEQNKSQK